MERSRRRGGATAVAEASFTPGHRPRPAGFGQDVELLLKRGNPLEMKVEHPAHFDQEILYAAEALG